MGFDAPRRFLRTIPDQSPEISQRPGGVTVFYALLFKGSRVGYCKVMQRAVIRVEGMDCEDCARAIARLLKQTPGVSTAEISLDKRQAVVELTSPADPTRIVVAIQNEGYGARVLR